MPDVFDAATRSAVMARVCSRGNLSTELKLVMLMRRAGVRGWRRGSKLRGRPDFIFRAEKIAVFADGCFWHGCPRCGEIPRANRSYWSAKITRNKRRDREVTKELRAAGWRVLRVWECALARTHGQEWTMRRIIKALHESAERRVGAEGD